MSDLSAAVEQALAARQGRRRGDELDFLCVAHEEKNPSASWNRRKGTWNCLMCGEGGTTADLARRLGLHVETPRERAQKGRIVATYDYRDEAGTLLYQTVRLQPKDFRQRRPDGSGWAWNLTGVRLVLYRLPELLTSSGRVYVTEGEKDADNLHAAGLTATTAPLGASKSGKSKWYPEYNEPLRGRDVVFLPDNDVAGVNHANFAAQSLLGVARSVKVLSLPGLPAKGGDVSDWLAAGGTAAELEALAEECPPFTPPREPAGAAAFDETDAGNAELFAHLYGERVRYDHRRGRWLVWERHRWVPDDTGELIRMAIEAARERRRAAAEFEGERAERAFRWAQQSQNHNRIENCLHVARAITPIADNGEGWDANPLLLAFENGVVNLATGELRPGQANDRITQTTHIVYDEDATCPRWCQFMAEVFPDPQVREFVRLAAGYSLTGLTREQVWFLCHGRGHNGKSTLLNVLRWVAGDYGHVMAFATIERGKEQSIPSDMAALAGKRVVTTSETDKATRFNEARLKQLTGEEPITARELYKPQFTYQPELKLWVAVNDKPIMEDDSQGNWRRVRLIPFTEDFTDRDDQNLKEKLRAELPGIARWMVQAAVDWHKVGLPIPPAIAVATVEYREESDPLAEFIRERCAVTAQASVQADVLYRAYKGWAEGKSYSQRETLSATMFGRIMADRYRRGAANGRRVYRGIGLLSDGWEPDPAPNRLPKSMVPDSVAGLLPKSELRARARDDDFPENSLQTLNPLPEVIGPCGCDGPGCEPCWADPAVEWWKDADGAEHCPTHHPILWSDSDGR